MRRIDWRQVGTWPVFLKLMAGAIAVVVLAVGLATFFNVRALDRELREKAHSEVRLLAVVGMGRLVESLYAQIKVIENIAADELFLRAAAAVYTEDEVRRKQDLWALEQMWETTADDAPLVQAVIDPQQNETTAQMFRYLEQNPDILALTLLDRYGAVLAATQRPERYYYLIEAGWWTVSYRGKRGFISLGMVEEPELALEVVVPVVGEERRLLGFVRALVRLDFIADTLRQVGFGARSGGISLVDARRRIIAAKYLPDVGRQVDESWLRMSYQDRLARWHYAVDAQGKPLLLGHQFIKDVHIEREGEVVVHGLDWVLFVSTPLKEAYRQARVAVLFGWLLAVVLAGVGSTAIWWLARSVLEPMEQLAATADRIAEGNLGVRAWVYAEDEIGRLARVINQLADDLEGTKATLKRQEEERVWEQVRRERDLEATAAVGVVASAAVDVGSLSREVVELIRERFSLYYVGLFLVDDSGEWAVLLTGTGEAGRAMVARGHRIRVGTGMVGWCIANAQRRVARDVGKDVVRLAPPELPYTRSEAALPLRSRGKVLGALTLHSYHSDAFDEETLVVLQTIADQIAVAIDGIRLFNERQEAMARLQRAYGEMSREAWERWLSEYAVGVGVGYQARFLEVMALDPADPQAWGEAARMAWEEGRVALVAEGQGQDRDQVHLALPVRARGGIVGVLDVIKRPEAAAQGWSRSEITLLEQFAEQLGLALENARLYEETQVRAMRERMVSEATSRMRETLDIETVLRVAADEIYRALGLGEVVVRLATSPAADEEQE